MPGKSDNKDKKAAIKSVLDIQKDLEQLQNVHSQLGKQIEEANKNADALYKSIEKDAEAEQKKRWDAHQKLTDDVFKNLQDITKSKLKTSSKAAQALDDYIRG